MAMKPQLTHLAHMALGAGWIITACSESTDLATTGAPQGDQAYPGTIFGTGDESSPTGSAAIAAEVDEVLPDAAFSCKTQSPTPTFCDDFDGPQLRDVWDTVTIAHSVPTSNGSIDQNALDSISAPNALLVALSSPSSDADLQNYVTKSFGQLSQVAAHFEIELDLKVEEFDHRPDRMLTPFQLAFGILTAQSYGQRSLVVVSDGSHVNLRVAELSMSTDTTQPVTTLTNAYPEAFLLEQNKWVHVKLETDVTRNSGDLLRLTVSGEQIMEHNMAFAPHALDTRIQLGQTWVESTDGAQEWRLRFDNVVVRGAAL